MWIISLREFLEIETLVNVCYNADDVADADIGADADADPYADADVVADDDAADADVGDVNADK